MSLVSPGKKKKKKKKKKKIVEGVEETHHLWRHIEGGSAAAVGRVTVIDVHPAQPEVYEA